MAKTKLSCEELVDCLQDKKCCEHIVKNCPEEEKEQVVAAMSGVRGAFDLALLASLANTVLPLLMKYALEFLNKQKST